MARRIWLWFEGVDKVLAKPVYDMTGMLRSQEIAATHECHVENARDGKWLLFEEVPFNEAEHFPLTGEEK